MIFTSNYARDGNDPNAIAISVKPPSYYKGKIYLPLAPTWELVHQSKKGLITHKQYTEQYLQLLKQRNVDPFKVLEDIGENAILLCYEPPGQHCHRHIAAKWIYEHTGVEIPEKSLYNENIILRDLFDI